MKIGLDIDNVITAFDDKILEEFYIEDKKKRNKGIVNPSGSWIKYQFDWSKEEVDEFFNQNMERMACQMSPRKEAKYYMERLIEDGHQLILISHRAYPHYHHAFETTKNWLETYHIPYTKLVLSETTNKSKECLENQIDVMFDDVVSNCQKLRNENILCFLMETKYNKDRKEGLDFVRNWKELYQTVCKLAKEKLPLVHVILDTDINNEADDQFALSYLLHSEERILLDAVTIAPYCHENRISVAEGIQKSFHVAKEIFQLCGKEERNSIIYKGATDYLSNHYEEENDAVNKIIEVAKRNEMTYILAIGAITNIALAIKKCSQIIPKIKVIWLGGHSLMAKNNREYNFRQDIEADRIVFYSGVDLTVIPCQNVASNLVTSIYELEHYLDIHKGLGKFLYDRFYQDGIHGITTRRTIWDIAVVAYVINPFWFEKKKVKCPIINDQLEYEKSKFDHEITFVTNLQANEIYQDMFERIGDKNEINK